MQLKQLLALLLFLKYLEIFKKIIFFKINVYFEGSALKLKYFSKLMFLN